VDAHATTDQASPLALLARSMDEARIPRKRNHNRAAVREVNRELVVGHADLKRASFSGFTR